MKRLFRKARDAAAEIDDTLPEIRDAWCVARDGVWAYIRATLIITTSIMALGVVIGLGGMGYALLNNANADTIFGDVEDCSKQRRCGYMQPVYRAAAGGGIEFTGAWRGATAQGHNPRISCPPGLRRWPDVAPAAAGADDAEAYTCINMSAPPVRAGEPALRPCYGEGGQPCNGIAERWRGEWYGTWLPGYTPPQCPLPLVAQRAQPWELAAFGQERWTCGSPF